MRIILALVLTIGSIACDDASSGESCYGDAGLAPCWCDDSVLSGWRVCGEGGDAGACVCPDCVDWSTRPMACQDVDGMGYESSQVCTRGVWPPVPPHCYTVF